MEFPHILLSLPKWWPSSGNREETVPLPPSPQSPSEALRFTREPILDSSGTPRPSCMNQQTWAAGGMGRGCRAPPPITAWLPAPGRQHITQFAISSLWTAASLPFVGSHQAPHICSFRGWQEDSSHRDACEVPSGFHGARYSIVLQKAGPAFVRVHTHGGCSTSCFLYLPFLTNEKYNPSWNLSHAGHVAYVHFF